MKRWIIAIVVIIVAIIAILNFQLVVKLSSAIALLLLVTVLLPPILYINGWILRRFG